MGRKKDYHECTRIFEVVDDIGMHGRSASAMLDTLKKDEYANCRLYVMGGKSGRKYVDVTSTIMGLMALEIGTGTEMGVKIRGQNGDADACLKELESRLSGIGFAKVKL